MKISLRIVDLTEYDEDDELNYDDYPLIDHIFYTIDAIRPISKVYSAVISGGYEYIAKVSFSTLEKLIDKSKMIIINEN